MAREEVFQDIEEQKKKIERGNRITHLGSSLCFLAGGLLMYDFPLDIPFVEPLIDGASVFAAFVCSAHGRKKIQEGTAQLYNYSLRSD